MRLGILLLTLKRLGSIFLISMFLIALYWLGDGPVVERLPHNRQVMGSSPGRVIPKTLKMVLTGFSSGARCMRMEWES